MGKVKRLRQKLHSAAKSQKVLSVRTTEKTNTSNAPDSALSVPSDDLFAGLDINIATLKTKLDSDDARSVKSAKSNRTEKSKSIFVPKKEKLKKRRQVLLKKIDEVNQMKKALKLREKRKKTAIMGDTNALHDALPSLESLLKNRPNIKQNVTETKKRKGIEKARKRKKQLVQGVKIFKSVLSNKTFQKNPLEAISQHVQALVIQEKQKVRK